MKASLSFILIIIIFFNLSEADPLSDPLPLQMGHIQLYSSVQTSMDPTYPFPYQFQHGTTFIIHMRSMRIQNTVNLMKDGPQWQIKILQGSQQILLRSSSFPKGSNLKIQITYLAISSFYSQSALQMRDLTINSSQDKNNLKRQMQVSFIKYKNEIKTKDIKDGAIMNDLFIFQRGFKMKNNSQVILGIFQKFIDINEKTFQLKIKMEDMELCHLTIIAISKQRLLQFGLQISPIKQSQRLSYNSLEIKHCLSQLQSENGGCIALQTYDIDLQVKKINKRSNNYEGQDIYTKGQNKRMLSGGCSSGYYQTSSKSCLLCSASLTNCNQCELAYGKNYPICKKCVNLYTVINNTCAACPVTCSECQTKIQSNVQYASCKKCISNLIKYQIIHGVQTCGCSNNLVINSTTLPISCVSCPSSCTSCTSITTCTGCVSGKYLFGSSCLSCMSVCKTCTTNNTCGSCPNTNFILSAGICTCKSPYFFSSSSKNCVSCSSLQGNCSSCGYASTFLPDNPPAVICITANTGFYVNNGTATPCISYCLNCNSSSLLCDTPASTFALNGSNIVCASGLYFKTNACTSCSSIITGCLACQENLIPSPTSCILCANGTYNSTNYPVFSCPACPTLCVTCNNLTDCITCINNLVPILGGTCGCNSSLVYDYTSKTCLNCNLVIFNCQNCISNATASLTCTNCGVGLYVNNNGTTCSSCPDACSSCSNSTYCTTCQADYNLDTSTNMCICSINCTNCMGNSTDGLCSSCTYSPSFTCLDCLAGNYLNTNLTCSSCASFFPNCVQCTISACSTCQPTFILTPSGCICNNTANLYLSTNGSTCLSCGSVISNCLSCSFNGSSTICTTSANGFFITNNSLNCDPCSGYCLTCSVSATFCDNCLPTFSMVSSSTCNCDNITRFYDSSIQGCSLCLTLFPNCITCTSPTSCLTCANQFYWNSTTTSCVACPSTCGNCSSPLICTSCPNTFSLSETVPGWSIVGSCICDNSSSTPTYYDQVSVTCVICSQLYPSCTVCIANATNAFCGSCADGTYLNNGSCVNCPLTCGNCSSSTVCTSCNGNLTLSNGTCICDSACSQCQGLSKNCLSCTISGSAITSCLSCQSGTYLSSPNCITCPTACVTCLSSTACLTCKPSYILTSNLCACATALGIFPNSLSVCVPCAQIIYSCIQCTLATGSTTCADCAKGYYVSNGTCQSCISNCLECFGIASNCTSCAQGQTLVNNTCTCTDAACVACNTTSPNCIQCVYTIYGNFSKCNTCKPGFYLNGINCSSCPTSCVTCTSGGICLTCPSTYQIINGTCECNYALLKSAGLCKTCTSLFPNCQICIPNASMGLNVSCSACLNGYYIFNSSCKASVCGDGVVTSGQDCDDGNTISSDGCTKFCIIQSSFNCSGQPSVCTVNLNYHITFKSLTVSPTICNRISIAFTMDPVYASYNGANFFQMLSYVANPNLQYHSWTYDSGTVTYIFDYSSTLDNQTVMFYFAPASLGLNQTSTIPIMTSNVLLISNNNLAVVYYSQQDCQSKTALRGLIKTAEYASYGIMIISALPCKIVGLEMMGVMQLAYLSVGNMDNVDTMLTPFMDMKSVQGFSFDLGKQSKQSRLLQSGLTPSRVNSIGYEANFLRNCNAMLIIVLAIVIIALIIYLCAIWFQHCAPSLYAFSKRLLKEVLLTVILFNSFNFAYSAGIHFKYAPTNDHLYTIGTISAIVALILPILMALGLTMSDDVGFGEFKQKFKPSFLDRLYFVITILYRTGIGLYISTNNEDSLSTLMVMGLSIAFLMYNLVNLPYAHAYHNYRANICHFAQCICLFVAMYYRSMMSSNTKASVSDNHTPAYLQITAILMSLVVSLIVLIYEIYIFVKQCCLPQRQKRKIRSRINSIENTSQNQNIKTDNEFERKSQPNEKNQKNFSFITVEDLE